MANPWVRSWPVIGTSGKEYKVSQRLDGSYGCECYAWRFQKGQRKDCQHILQVILKETSPKKVSINTKANHETTDTLRSITFED